MERLVTPEEATRLLRVSAYTVIPALKVGRCVL